MSYICQMVCYKRISFFKKCLIDGVVSQVLQLVHWLIVPAGMSSSVRYGFCLAGREEGAVLTNGSK